MARMIKKQITCPKCKKLIETKLTVSLNVTGEPGFRDKVFDESLFSWECPHCKVKTQILYPFLYHDINRDFMIYFIPDTKQNFFSDSSLEKEFNDLENVTKRLVSSLNDLKEKVLIFESMLDDKAIELVKLRLQKALEYRLKEKICASYFCLIDRDLEKISFAFFSSTKKEAYHQSIEIQDYEDTVNLLENREEDKPQISKFMKIDSNWAKSFLMKK